MTTETERWCRLNRRLEVGGEKFEAGEIFRVAHLYPRDDQEDLLTLDGNEDSFHWSSALVVHNVPASAVTILHDNVAVAGSAGQGKRRSEFAARSQLTNCGAVVVAAHHRRRRLHPNQQPVSFST